MTYFKHTFFVIIPMVIGSFKARAGLPLPMASDDPSWLNSFMEGNSLEGIPLKGELFINPDSLLLLGFCLWIAYIVFCFPKNTLNKR